MEIPQYYSGYTEEEIESVLERNIELERCAIKYFSTELKERILKEAAKKDAYIDVCIEDEAEVWREERMNDIYDE